MQPVHERSSADTVVARWADGWLTSLRPQLALTMHQGLHGSANGVGSRTPMQRAARADRGSRRLPRRILPKTREIPPFVKPAAVWATVLLGVGGSHGREWATALDRAHTPRTVFH